MPAWAVAALPLVGLGVVALLAFAAYAARLARLTTQVERVPVVGNPGDYALPHKNIAFTAADGVTLRGWCVPSKNNHACVVMVQGEEHHRNSPGIGALQLAGALAARGFSVLLFDLRGRGESGGRRASAGNQELLDVLAALHFVRTSGTPLERVALLGFSLGAGLSILAAARHPSLGALVCDSAFKDLLDDYQGLRMPAWALVPAVRVTGRILYNSDPGAIRPIKVIGSIRTPALFIHGMLDTVVSPDNTEALYTACGSARKELWLVPNAGHVQSYHAAGEAYVERVTTFLSGVL